jgi:hypothetical protein
MPSIPASQIVRVIPNVLSAGGSGLDLVGLILTNSNRVPIGSVARFVTADDVAAYFGPVSVEYTMASVYFAGYDNSNIKPAALLFSQYPAAAVPAYLRGGALPSLAALKALAPGVLTISLDGTAVTSGTINLSAATSYSNAAALITTALNTAGVTAAYDSLSNAFVITGATIGATATISTATGSLSAGVELDAASGAVTSAGSAAGVPGAAMDAVIATTQDFVSFTTAFMPSVADRVSFAQWTDGRDNRFLYAMWDNGAAATTSNDTTSAGYQIAQAGYSGTAPIYDPNNGALVAAGLLGSVASIDYGVLEGRTTLAFRGFTGVPAGVSNATIAANLSANGYNFYGSYATANDQFVWFYPGQVSGKFGWIDSYVNQIWMNTRFQESLMVLLSRAGDVPYNIDGYSLIEATMLDTITAAVDFGAIRAGVTLTNAQAAEVNNAAGRRISDILQTRGWYTVVLSADPVVRAARGTPPVYFFYLDGQSVQVINLSSVLVQ